MNSSSSNQQLLLCEGALVHADCCDHNQEKGHTSLVKYVAVGVTTSLTSREVCGFEYAVKGSRLLAYRATVEPPVREGLFGQSAFQWPSCPQRKQRSTCSSSVSVAPCLMLCKT